MKEKEPVRHFSDNVRDYAHKIVETHRDLLLIDNSILESTFADDLRKFQKSSKLSSYPFATDNLTAENELGLNLFLDVIKKLLIMALIGLYSQI